MLNLWARFSLATFLMTGLYLYSFGAKAQTTTDANALAQSLSSNFGPVAVVHLVARQRKGDGPVWVPIVVKEILTSGNVQIQNTSPITFGTPIVSTFPIAVGGGSSLVPNCTNLPAVNNTVNISVQETRAASASITSTLTNTKGFNLGFTYGAGKEGGFGVNGGISVSSASSQATTDSTSFTSQFTYQSSLTINNIPPKTAVLVTTTVNQVVVSVPFTVSVVLDSDLSPSDMSSWPNNIGHTSYKHLSDMYPAPLQRTVVVSGQLMEKDWNHVTSVPTNQTFDVSMCGAGSQLARLLPMKNIPISTMKGLFAIQGH